MPSGQAVCAIKACQRLVEHVRIYRAGIGPPISSSGQAFCSYFTHILLIFYLSPARFPIVLFLYLSIYISIDMIYMYISNSSPHVTHVSSFPYFTRLLAPTAHFALLIVSQDAGLDGSDSVASISSACASCHHD